MQWHKGLCLPHCCRLQNQNPFQTFTGLWLSLPRAAKALLLWAALQSAITIAYASAIFATPQASQEFVFPLLVCPAAHDLKHIIVLCLLKCCLHLSAPNVASTTLSSPGPGLIFMPTSLCLFFPEI